MFGWLKRKTKKVMPHPPNFHAEAVDELLSEKKGWKGDDGEMVLDHVDVDKRAKELKKKWLKKHSGGHRRVTRRHSNQLKRTRTHHVRSA